MKYLAIIIGLILVVPVFGQRKKNEEPIVLTPTYEEGITYALPRTGLRVYVRAIKETFEPGPYVGYAEQLLGLQNVKSLPESGWSVTEIRMETFSEPDPEQVYKAMGDVASMISLTANGCLSGINATNLNVKPVVVKTNKVIEAPDAMDDFSFDNFTDTPFYISGDSSNSFQPIRVSAEQKASEAAKKVLETRMNIYDMVAGMLDEFHPDGEAYKVSLEQLKEIEKNYLSLFTGRTTRKEDIFSFNYVPSKDAKIGEVIFRISNEKGIMPASDLSGKPVMVEFVTDENLTDKYADLAISENPDAGKNGIYYRMPGVVTVNILNDLNIISSARMTFAQFGEVAPLPEDLLEKGYVVRFHPETGAIKSVSKR